MCAIFPAWGFDGFAQALNIGQEQAQRGEQRGQHRLYRPDAAHRIGDHAEVGGQRRGQPAKRQQIGDRIGHLGRPSFM